MSVIPMRLSQAPRAPWGVLALVALLITLLVGALVVAGSRPNLPEPFGLAANGSVAYDADGDIFTADPVTGASQLVVAGTEHDSHPTFSRDGARIVFERREGNRSRLMAAAADGSGLVTVTPDPFVDVTSYSFSPDGREIAFVVLETALVTSSGEPGKLWIANADGRGARPLDVGMDAKGPTWLPPEGREILFSGPPSAADGDGLWAVDVATGAVRTILAPAEGVGRDLASGSPDGSRIAFSVADLRDNSKNTYQVHVVNTDGTGEIVLPMPEDATFQDSPAWSNDGRRLVVTRGYASRNQVMAVAILPADGSSVGIETARGLTGCCSNSFEWSPADTSILFLPEDFSGRRTQQLLIDPTTGATTPAPWAATSLPAWQRRIP